MPKPEKPEKGTPEYAAYKKAKKERKERREHGRSKSLTVKTDQNTLSVRSHSRAGSEFSYISSVGSGAEEEPGKYKKAAEEAAREVARERGLLGGYSVVGGGASASGSVSAGYQGSYGGSESYSPVSPVSPVSPSPGGAQQRSNSHNRSYSSSAVSASAPPPGQYPSYQQNPYPGQYPPSNLYPPPPGAGLAPPGQYGAPGAYPGYGYPPGYSGPPPLPPPSPGIYPQMSPNAPPPHDPQFAPLPPGFGTGGGVYPPGETPIQYNNPDYYAETHNPPHGTQTTQPYFPGQAGSSAGPYPAPLQLPAPPPPSQYPPVSGSSTAGASSTAHGAVPVPPPLPPKHGFLDSLKIPSFSSLSIKNDKPNQLPPPSPALQPYHGTYQSISPLPSPTLSPSPLFSASGSISIAGHSLNSAFSLGPSAFSPSPGGQSLHQTLTAQRSSEKPIATPVYPAGLPRPATPPYNPTDDAKAILSALKHTFRPPTGPLIEILPTLSPSQIMQLRQEYKSIFKQVNVAKHIKTVFPSNSYGGFGKIAFAVALGPYESEGWFANCWYQRRETRNELLIEALMGKSADEIRKIKAGFKDAKYLNSLEKVVRSELEGNKFRMAVLIQLEGVRMEETAEIRIDSVREDVRRLGEIMERRDARGGETQMIEILVNRSDRWIREMAGQYKATYQRDLAKAVMRHSKNLVGETLLHIINGAVDKPLRDAKLLEQAITALVEQGREDLLISRMVRVHWDPYHMDRVKKVYKKKFKVDLSGRLKGVVDGDFEKFLLRMLRD